MFVKNIINNIGKYLYGFDLCSFGTTTKNATFQRLMKEYTDDFALTQLNNAHSFDNNSSIRFIEKFKARSHFLNFVRETIEDGRKASFDLNDGKEQF